MNYLIFRTDRIGDFLITSPLIRAIKRNDTRSKIFIVVSNKNAEFIKKYDLVDEVFLLKSNKIKDRIDLFLELRKYKFNTIIVSDKKNRSIFFGFLLKAQNKIFNVSKNFQKKILNILYKNVFLDNDNLKDKPVKDILLDNSKSLLVAVSDTMSLGLLESPGHSGADIFVGDGQSIGNYMNYGGPMIGLMAIKEQYKRRMPGRIIGKTIDINKKVGYVLTLQTREQHIRRANATSNICTNQGLLALRTAIYLSLMGKNGLPYVANLCFQKAQYAASEISKLNHFNLKYSNNFIKEFIIETDLSASFVIKYCREKDILIDRPNNNGIDSLLQISVTEKRSRDEIDLLVSTLKELD